MRKLLKKGIAFLILLSLVFGAVGCGLDTKEQEHKAPLLKNEGEVPSDYDLIVYSGEPEGIAAAISAARNGLKTLLLVKQDQLGGLYTLGELNFIDVPETRDGKVLVKGIYKEFFDAVGGSAFDIEQAKQVFQDMVKKEKNITLRSNIELKKVLMKGNKIEGLQVTEDGNEKEYRAKTTIDASPDGDIAAMAGAPFSFGGEDIGLKDNNMGVTLVFSLSGIQWEAVTSYLLAQRAKGEVTGGKVDMGASGRMAWGYGKEGFAYKPKDPGIKLRGFNMAKQDNGDVLINALVLFDVDVLSQKSREQAIKRAQEELKYIVPYLRKTCVGFKKAKLAGTAQELYIRESRHFDCDYMLTVDDILENRGQPDQIAVTNYPVDIQATKSNPYGVVVGFGDQYSISYRSLLPKNIEQLYIVGRSAGFRSLAAGSARIVPTGMATGQGAGVAAAVAQQENISPRELSGRQDLIKKVQDLLVAQGASLAHTQTPEAVMNSWAYDGLKVLRSMGLISSGYSNEDYKLDEPISNVRYQNMINAVVKRAGFKQDIIYVNENPPTRQIIGTVARSMAKIKGIKLENNYNIYFSALEEAGIMTPELKHYFIDKEKQPKAAECVVLVANYYRWMIKQPGGKSFPAIDV